MLCNIDTNNAIETGSQYTLQLLDKLGMWGAILFLVFLVLMFMSVYVVIAFTKKILHRKEYKLEKLKEENKSRELKQAKETLKKMISLYEESNRSFKLLGDKIQFSLNIDRMILLTDCFIGTDRSFIQDLKSKLMFYVENTGRKKVNNDFMYLYHEVEIIFKQKVIDKLRPSLFKDRATFYKIEKDCRATLKQSLDKIRKNIEKTSIKDIHKLSIIINEELRDLGSMLQEIIISSYKKQITGSTDIDYMRL